MLKPVVKRQLAAQVKVTQIYQANFYFLQINQAISGQKTHRIRSAELYFTICTYISLAGMFSYLVVTFFMRMLLWSVEDATFSRWRSHFLHYKRMCFSRPPL